MTTCSQSTTEGWRSLFRLVVPQGRGRADGGAIRSCGPGDHRDRPTETSTRSSRSRGQREPPQGSGRRVQTAAGPSGTTALWADSFEAWRMVNWPYGASTKPARGGHKSSKTSGGVHDANDFKGLQGRSVRQDRADINQKVPGELPNAFMLPI